MCRDGSGAYAEAIRRALPQAIQVTDRWHLWHNLGDAVLKEVAAHSACWATTGVPLQNGKRAQTTRERWHHVHDLLGEIKNLGYRGSFNLLYRYITQGRVEADRLPISSRHLARLLLTRPGNLTGKQQRLRDELTAACPEMIDVAGPVRAFADLLRPREGNADRLDTWITAARAADLPHPHAFTRGLDQDRDAVRAAVTLPHHNGGTEGVNTRTKRILRQMHGRAGFALLRHRTLLE